MNPDYLHPELFPKNFSPNLTNPDHQLAKKAPIIATEIDFAGENLGEFNLPVSTQIANENSQNLQSSFFDLLDGVQGLTNYGQNVSLTPCPLKTNKSFQEWSGGVTTALKLHGGNPIKSITLEEIQRLRRRITTCPPGFLTLAAPLELVTPLDFDGSFNPISNRRGKLCPPHYLQPRIFKSYYFNSFVFVSTLTLTDLLNRLDDLDPKNFYGFFSLPSLIFKKPDDSTSSQAQTQRRVLGRGGEARGKGPI